MSLRKEVALETEICAHLADRGWLHTQGDAAHYDCARALYPPDLIEPPLSPALRWGVCGRDEKAIPYQSV